MKCRDLGRGEIRNNIFVHTVRVSNDYVLKTGWTFHNCVADACNWYDFDKQDDT